MRRVLHYLRPDGRAAVCGQYNLTRVPDECPGLLCKTCVKRLIARGEMPVGPGQWSWMAVPRV